MPETMEKKAEGEDNLISFGALDEFGLGPGLDFWRYLRRLWELNARVG